MRTYCPVCGYEMGPFEEECRRCRRMEEEARAAPPPAPAVPLPAEQQPHTPSAPQAAPQAEHPSDVVMQAVGCNGQLELLRGKIRIRRAGLLALLGHGLKGDKEILISQISSVQFKNAGPVLSGYIQFSFLGGQETKSGIFDAAGDENTVMFILEQQPAFETIRAAIDREMMAAHTGGGQNSILDELERLASLRDRGIINEEEFETQKRRILG